MKQRDKFVSIAKLDTRDGNLLYQELLREVLAHIPQSLDSDPLTVQLPLRLARRIKNCLCG